MPGDELHQEAGAAADAAPEAASARSGPRHAAPKKPLLNRLHLPAGKAIAIAAMPSAVLMGMGITPQLASAKGLPKSPYRPGPCVSQPDKEPDEGKTEKEKVREKAQKEKIEAAKKKVEAAKRKAEEEKKKREADEAGKDDSSGKDSGSSDSDKPSPSPSPGGGDSGSGSSDSGEKKNPLDPLGVGDAIGKAVGGDKSKDEDDKSGGDESADKSGSGSSGSDRSSSDGSGKDSSKGGHKGAGSAAGDAAGKVGDGVKDTTDKLGKGARDTADGGKGGGKDDTSGASDDKAGKSGADGGKKAFPCPEEKKSEGKDEQTPAPLPDKPWRLEASSVALHKLDYKGVVNITASDGTKKQALKFTADSIDIGDLHQIVYGKDGTKYHVQAAKGSTSTFRGGQVTLYTEKLKGNLFGVVPIVFDPEHPPPLNVPEAVFTDVEITQAGQFGGNLTIPGLHQHVEQ